MASSVEGINPHTVILDTVDLNNFAGTPSISAISPIPVTMPPKLRKVLTPKAKRRRIYGIVLVILMILITLRYLYLVGMGIWDGLGLWDALKAATFGKTNEGWLGLLDKFVFLAPIWVVPAVVIPAFFLSLILYPLPPILFVFHPLKKAKYKWALWLARFFRRVPLPLYGNMGLFVEGTVQSFAGNFTEAERLLCKSLAKESNRSAGDSAYENLGMVYLHQRRFKEAAHCLDNAVQLSPLSGGKYGCLAHVYLRQGLNPTRALLLLQRGLELKTKPRRIHADKYQISEMWMDVAWAYELLGQRAESDAALQKAFVEGDPNFIPARAGLYWRAAEIMRLRGQLESAIATYQEAIETDAVGAYGKLAAQSLKELTANLYP